eukprot:5268148-Pyramimonas_sp.AAC.1
MYWATAGPSGGGGRAWCGWRRPRRPGRSGAADVQEALSHAPSELLGRPHWASALPPTSG